MRRAGSHLVLVCLLLGLAAAHGHVIQTPRQAHSLLLPAHAKTRPRQHCCDARGRVSIHEQVTTMALTLPPAAQAATCPCFAFEAQLHTPPAPTRDHGPRRPSQGARCYDIHQQAAGSHLAPAGEPAGREARQQPAVHALGRVHLPSTGAAAPLQLQLSVPQPLLQDGAPLLLAITPCTPGDPPPPQLRLTLHPQHPSRRPARPAHPHRKLLQLASPPPPSPRPDCSLAVDTMPVNCGRVPQAGHHLDHTWEIVVVVLFCLAAVACLLPGMLWFARKRGGAVNWARCPGCCCCPDDERDLAVTSLITLHGGALERTLTTGPDAAQQQEPSSPMPGKLITYTPRTSISRASTPRNGTPLHGTPRHHHAMSPRSYHGGTEHPYAAPQPHHAFHLDTLTCVSDPHRPHRLSTDSHASHTSSLHHPSHLDPGSHSTRTSLDALHHTPPDHPRAADHHYHYHDVLHDTILETAMPIPLQLEPKVWPSSRLAHTTHPDHPAQAPPHRPATPSTPPAALPAPALPPIRTSPPSAHSTTPAFTPPSPPETPPAPLPHAPSAELELVYQSALYSTASAAAPLPATAAAGDTQPPTPPASASTEAPPHPAGPKQGAAPAAAASALPRPPARILVLRVGDEGWAEAVAAAARQARATMEQARTDEEATAYGSGSGSGSDSLGGTEDDMCSVSSGHETESEHACAICLEAYEVGEVLRLLPCNHHFHQECVDTWLPQHACCPICRNRMAMGHTDWSILDDPMHFPPCGPRPAAARSWVPPDEPPASSSARSPASSRPASLAGGPEDTPERVQPLLMERT